MLGSYAAIIIPTESNFQKSLSDTYSAVVNLIREGFDVYYSLKPFTVRVYEAKSDVRPYVRTFGINTFIVKVYDKKEFEEVLNGLLGKARVNYTFDRIWVKGRKVVDAEVCVKNYLNTPISNVLKSSGFKLTCNNARTFILCHNELSYLFFKDKLLEEKIAEYELTIKEIRILKPWHTIVYGTKTHDLSGELVKHKEKYLIFENMFAEELIIALSDYGKIPLVTVSEKYSTICLNNVFNSSSSSFFKIVLNSTLYMLSHEVNVSV